MKNICVITGTRADYGLLYWVMKAIENSPKFNLQLIATGMHLSSEFGLTYKQIEKDGFKIDKKLEILVSSDSSTGISKSMGLAMISFSEAFEDLKPDIILLLGDRFEIFSASSSAMISRIPIIHCHGGESTEGLIDEPIRHSISKMSHLHFCSTDIYKKRIIQLGENPKSVYNVGALGIENINKLKLMSKSKFEKSISLKLDKKYTFLVTFHPVTLENSTSKNQMLELLNALDSFDNCKIIFTMSNSDTNGRVINEIIENYVKKNSNKAVCFISLGQLRYLSALKYVDCVIGNSSSGLIEAPSFGIGTVNIGDRQRGRLKGETVIDCIPRNKEIISAINKVVSKEFISKIKNSKNPYGDGNSSEKILKILQETNFDDILKKRFYDLQ